MGHLTTLRSLGAALAWVIAASAFAVVAARALGGSSSSNLVLLGIVLVGVGAVAILIAAATARWAPRAALQHQLTMFGALGLALLVANVVVGAALMLLTVSDLGLLVALGAYAVIATVGPARLLSRSLSQRIERLDAAARQVAEGDLGTRVSVDGGDEIARLGQSFNAMAAEIQAASQRRESLERSRRYLFAAISHDLRTPLSAIRAMVEALSDEVVTDPVDVRRYLETMGFEVGQLSLLIDDLFELATIDAGDLRLQFEPLHVEEVLEEALDLVRPEIERAGIHLAFEPAPAALPVHGDPRHLGRVASNLLQNAIRHTPCDGSIVVRTVACATEVRVSVADTGDGIKPGDLPHVFEQFYRGEPSRSRETGGSGLGLSIARGIVEAHGGEIWIEPGSRRGTTVVFTLPAAPAASTLPRAARGVPKALADTGVPPPHRPKVV